MKVGVPAEVKNNEFRVAITPAGVHELTGAGHEVFVEAGAGEGSSLPDEEFAAAGAVILPAADDVWAAGDLVLKVKALFGVAVASARSAWAVGCSGVCGKGGKTLLLHWNGTTWSQVTSPKPVYGTLNAVTVVSADDAWAVGQTTNAAGGDDKPLILHWNGKAWTKQSGVPAVSARVGSVTEAGGTVWAIGLDYNAEHTRYTAVSMLWNGKKWQKMPTGDLLEDSFLQNVAFAGSGDAWGVGYAGPSALTLHWNGKSWS